MLIIRALHLTIPQYITGVLDVPDIAQGSGFECYSEVDLSLE